MTKREARQDGARDVAERSEAESRAPARPVAEGVALPPAGTPGRCYAPEEKASALRAYASSGERMREWCAVRGISTATRCAWRRAYARGGVEALAPRPRAGRTPGTWSTRPITPEQRREAIAAYKKSGLTQEAFCRLWGVSMTSLRRWIAAHRQHGPRGLEAPWGGRRRGRKKEPIPESVRAEIVATKARFPHWGLRRIRDALARFSGLRALPCQTQFVGLDTTPRTRLAGSGLLSVTVQVPR